MAYDDCYVSEQDIDDEIFGEQSQSTISYLRDRVDRYASNIGNAFNGFFSDTRELFDRFNGEAAQRRIRKRLRKVATVFTSDNIRPLSTMDDIQKAKPTMQRYIMANTVAQMLKEAQAIDGYSDDYQNPYHGKRGMDNPDFMRVIDGIVFTEDKYGLQTENENNAWVAYQDLYYNPDEPGLDAVQQGDVMSTWDYLEVMLADRKEDPTSILKEKM